MLALKERIDILVKAGDKLKTAMDEPDYAAIFSSAESSNHWFTQSNIKKSIAAITSCYTDRAKIEKWIGAYKLPENSKPKILGLLLAGNIPFVGINDIISGFITGH